ncbi:MAG: FHA domain-containing protein [Planctomycetes bacterium]|nr:FHA domain-containing protein [Planctomycetota bacterium]
METIECLTLKGIKGIADGEVFYVNYGQIVTVGRSRECDISFRRFKKFKDLPKEKEDNEGLVSVSRKHLRIAFYNSQCVELKDLSSNGSFLNNEQIKKKIIDDIKEKTYEIRLGSRETFQLTWGKKDITNQKPETNGEEKESSKKPA